MTVYLDYVFLLNVTIDYFLCLLTARSAGIPLKRTRYLLAALIGGLYAVVVFLPDAWFLATSYAKISVGLLIPLIAYCGEIKLPRLILSFEMMSCVAAGVVFGLGFLLAENILLLDLFSRTAILIGAFSGLWVILDWVFRPTIQHGIRGNLLPAQISIAGSICSMTALHDTGNQLRDPIHGDPILIISQRHIEHLLPDALRKQIKTVVCPSELLEPFLEYAPELRPCLLPYRAVGQPSGLLLTLRTDWGNVGGIYHQNLTIALTPEKLSSGYDALWGGDFKKGGRYDRTNPITSLSEEIPSCAGDLLHRWKRHSSASADKRTGSLLTRSDRPARIQTGAD